MNGAPPRPSSEAKGFEVNPKDLGGKSFAFSWSTSAGFTPPKPLASLRRDVKPEGPAFNRLRPPAVSPRRSVAYGNTSLEAEGFWVGRAAFLLRRSRPDIVEAETRP